MEIVYCVQSACLFYCGTQWARWALSLLLVLHVCVLHDRLLFSYHFSRVSAQRPIGRFANDPSAEIDGTVDGRVWLVPRIFYASQGGWFEWITIGECARTTQLATDENHVSRTLLGEVRQTAIAFAWVSCWPSRRNDGNQPQLILIRISELPCKMCISKNEVSCVPLDHFDPSTFTLGRTLSLYFWLCVLARVPLSVDAHNLHLTCLFRIDLNLFFVVLLRRLKFKKKLAKFYCFKLLHAPLSIAAEKCYIYWVYCVTNFDTNLHTTIQHASCMYLVLAKVYIYHGLCCSCVCVLLSSLRIAHDHGRRRY